MAGLTLLTSESSPLYCASYTRISKVRGAKDDPETTSGVRRQAEQNGALAASRGWTVGDVYQDNDITASGKKKRPEFERLLQDLEAGRFQRLIVWHADRLTRIRADLDRLIDVCNRRNIEIETVRSGKIDLSTPAGRLVARLQQDVAHHELEHAQERIIAKHEQLAREGKPSGGRRIFGWEKDQITRRAPTLWCRVSDRQEIKVDEQDIIKEMAKRCLEGESLHALARELRRREVPSTHGGTWKAETLFTILVSARIAGMREVFGRDENGKRVIRGTTVAKAKWDPIIDLDTHRALRDKLFDPSRRTTVGQSSSPHPLVGLLVCECGSRMYSKGRQADAFHCKECFTTISGKYLVPPIYDAVGVRVRAGDLEAALQQRPDATGLTEALEDLDKQDKFLAAEWAAKRISGVAWTTAADLLGQQRREIERQLQDVYKQAGLVYVVDRRNWDALTDAQRKGILGFFLRKVIIRKSTLPRGIVDPNRIELEWKC